MKTRKLLLLLFPVIIVVIIITCIIAIDTPKQEEKEAHPSIAQTRSQDYENVLYYLASDDSLWVAPGNGTDAATLFLPHYDSILSRLRMGRVYLHVAERVQYLRLVPLKYRAEKGLPGKWELVARSNSSGTWTPKKTQFEFFSDHTFSYSDRVTVRDTFVVGIGKLSSLGLFFPNYHRRTWPSWLYSWKEFQLNGDTLRFKKEDCRDCETSVFVRVK